MNIRSCTAPIVLSLAFAAPIQAQAPLPAGWPNRLELGMGDGPGGAAAMKATAPFAFRYQYSSPGIPLMSTSIAGAARRVFIIGMRLWPPARKRTSSPPSRFAVTASSTEWAATYSNEEGNTMDPPLAPFGCV